MTHLCGPCDPSWDTLYPFAVGSLQPSFDLGPAADRHTQGSQQLLLALRLSLYESCLQEQIGVAFAVFA